jgi:hypothetical protein
MLLVTIPFQKNFPQYHRSSHQNCCIAYPLPDPWPLAKITINMESASQWVSKWEDFFFADEYVRHYVDAHTAKQSMPQVTAIKLV